MEEKVLSTTIDEYISQFPTEIQEKLREMRRVIKESAREAQEKISWQMPTFTLYGNLVHFAVCKNHIGFYPGVSGVEAFKDEISEYTGTKGSLHFPIDKPLPYELIKKIVQFRAAENERLAKKKKTSLKD